MMNLKLYVLAENIAGGRFRAEHGLSYLIDFEGEKILFDTGQSDLFLQNASLFGLNFNEVKTVVLSHGHWDHGNGLPFLSGKNLVTHPAAFTKRFRKTNNSSFGLNLSKEEIQQKYELTESAKPVQILEHLYFLGEIPRKLDFEKQAAFSINEKGEHDLILDDSALAALVNGEIVVITGCSHSGICNICEHAKTVLGTQKIKAVIGGFHLKENDAQTQNTILYFKQNNIAGIYPSHCTELPVLAAFHTVLDSKAVKTGMIIEFN